MRARMGTLLKRVSQVRILPGAPPLTSEFPSRPTRPLWIVVPVALTLVHGGCGSGRHTAVARTDRSAWLTFSRPGLRTSTRDRFGRAARCGRSATAGPFGPAGDAGGNCRCRLERERHHRDHLGCSSSTACTAVPSRPVRGHAAGGGHCRRGTRCRRPRARRALQRKQRRRWSASSDPIVEKLQTRLP
jgi:hypothetical protein